MTIAVITPYYREDRVVLERCIGSVARQTRPCVHYLVADGHPQTWVDGTHRNRHLKLPVASRDFGNTPRALGALTAVSQGAAAIAFLDADNHYDPDHIEMCNELAKARPMLGYVAAEARTVLIDGTVVPNTSENPASHVDTSCLYLLPPAFPALSQWVLQPKPLTVICDRLYLMRLRAMGLEWVATGRPTLTYVSTWAVHYKAMGRPPPPGAKPQPDVATIVKWWQGLPETQKAHARVQLGLPTFDMGVSG